MNFSTLLSRADDQTLQELIGKPVVRLLRSLDPELARPSRLRELLVDARPADSMLRDSPTRAVLLSLLRPEDAMSLADRLGVASESGEVYGELQEKRFRKGSAAEAELFSFFGVRPDSDLDPPRVSPSSTQVCGDYGLFYHQRDAVRRVRRALSQPPRRVVLHMPTGAGKTRTAMNLIAEEFRRLEPTLVVWLAYSEELCDQTVAEFHHTWRALGDRELPVHRYWGTHNLSVDTLADGLVVAGLGKLFSAARRDYTFLARLADRASLVVIDEAHQAIAETYKFLLEVLVERDVTTGLLGLTATPGRTWNDIDEDERLSTFFARNKIGLRIEGYSNPVDYLVDNEYLARPQFRRLSYSAGGQLSAEDLRQLGSSLDVPASILRKLAEDERRNLLIVDKVEGLAQRHRRILVFAATVEHALLLAMVLRARGLRAFAITGTTGRADRARLISGYRSDHEEPRVLVNFGVLTAGFDAPQTSAAVIARPTRSLVLYSQMVGRATRGPKAGGNREAEIVTIVDTALPGFANVADAFVNWEDVWHDND